MRARPAVIAALVAACGRDPGPRVLASVGPAPRAFARLDASGAFLGGAVFGPLLERTGTGGKTLAQCGISLPDLAFEVAIGEPLRVAADIDGAIDVAAVTCFLGASRVRDLAARGITVADRAGGIAVDFRSDRGGNGPASPITAGLVSRCARASCAVAALGPIEHPLWVAVADGDALHATLSGPVLGDGAARFADALTALAGEDAELHALAAREENGGLVIEYPTTPSPGQILAMLDLVEFFRIPSASMIPTLLAGDYVIAVKGRLRGPLVPGDVIVYRHEGAAWLKRYIAPAGASVSESERGIAIDGSLLAREVEDPAYRYVDDPDDDRSRGTVKSGALVREHLGARSYLTLKTGTVIAPGPWSVPGESIFVLGDNRNNSYDSRFSGAVLTAAVYGRAVGIWLSYRDGVPDWNRMGTALE